MKFTPREIALWIFTDTATMRDDEPWGLRERWMYFKIAMATRKIYRTVLALKKRANISYDSEVERTGLVVGFVASMIRMWTGVRGTVVTLAMSQGANGGVEFSAGGEGQLGSFMALWRKEITDKLRASIKAGLIDVPFSEVR